MKAMIAAEPDNPTPLYNLGLVYSDQGKLEEAKDLLQQAAILDSGNAQIVVAIGVAYARGGDAVSAIETLERAIPTISAPATVLPSLLRHLTASTTRTRSIRKSSRRRAIRLLVSSQRKAGPVSPVP